MAEAPAGGGAKQDPQALIAKHAAVTQSGAAGDAAIVTRVEASIKNSPMGWLQGVLGETSGRATAEQGEVHGKLAEHQDLVAKSAKDAPKDAGPAPAPGPAAHPAVPHPAAAGAKAAVVAPQAANGGAPAEHTPIAGHAPAKSGAASPPTAAPAPTIAAAVASGGDGQLDGILNGYTPKSPQTTQTLGRIKQMGDVASGFSGQLDVYVSQGGAIDSTIAGASNFLGVGKEAGAVWRNNPYRKVHGVLGGIMTGMSAVKNVCGIVGSVCGKLGMVLTVIGLLGMIFPPIGAAVSGIARILSVVGMICDAISFVLSGILTGLNGVVLAQQIAAGASAEEKAASADLMMSEANEAASGFVNLAMVFGPKFMKGMLGSSKGIVASLIKRAKATIGRISLKVSANVSHFANKIVRKLGFGGANMSRVGGAWKDTGFVAGMKDKWAGSKVGKIFNGAPQHIEAVQEKLMAKYGNTTWAKNMDRVGAWGGSVAHRFDIEEKVGKMGESSGKWVGGIGADTKLGKSLAASAERSEMQTRELAMQMSVRDATHLEQTRWRNELDRRQKANPDHIRDRGVEDKFVAGQGAKMNADATTSFSREENTRGTKERLEQRRTDRFERRNDEFYDNKTNAFTGKSTRDEMMDQVHGARERRWNLEATMKAQETERKDLLGKATKSAEEQTRLTALNSELRPLDEARRLNKMYETDLSGLAAGTERVRKPEYNNWKDVGSNAWDATTPVLEMMHLKDQDSAWASAEKANLKKQTKYSKGSAQANAAGRGGHGTLEEIAAEQRRRELDEVTAFVRATPQSTTLSSRVGSMLSPITSRVQKPQIAAPTATTATPAPAAQGGVTVAPTEHKEEHGEGAIAVAAQVHEAPAITQEAEPDAEGGGEALPYWPALLPEFDQAQKDFGWMRKVAVEFKHAQIDGKQKAVDTLAVYGRYKEYSALRSAAAKKNQAGAAQTSQATAANVGHAAQTEGQAGQGEAKQGEAKGAANDKAATDLPEPESRGFWGRILGAVKRWAKNKAAQVFGWIQEKVASVIMKGLCGVSMGDMREYAGALRHQQQAAHGVANEAGTTSAAAEGKSVKLSSDATKEAQGAADAIGECDKNIVDADTFMADITSFESQLAEEKANAQIFISQVQAAAHAEQARKKAEAEQRAAEEAKQQQRAAALGGGANTATASAPTPGPTAEPAHAEPETRPEGDADAGTIHAAADFVASESEALTSRLDARADDYTNQLALALTNKTGKSADNVDLKGPAKKESKHIVEEFKNEAKHSKADMEAFHTIPIEPSQAKRIAEQIITVAQHLESSYTQSENALDELFARTYNGIKDGKRTLKSKILDGDNMVGEINHAGDKVEDKVIDHSLPALNVAWNTVAKPIQVPASAPEATPAPKTEARPPSNDTMFAGDGLQQDRPILMASNDMPVQRKSDGDAQVEAPGDVAAKGVASATGRMPHHDQIQASFGKHDISHVRAQVGGEATEASRGLGASAYATGDKVGFAKSPDLHTAAHEAAHVVQQRQGVQLKGGLDGGKGDPHEQHADAVADKVVRGESAEQLLGNPGGAGGGAAVQRAPEDAQQTKALVDAGPVVDGQMLKQAFIAALKPQVTAVANEELGRLGSAIGCHYIEEYFAKYSALPAESSLQLIHRWVPSTRGVTSATALIPLLMERVRAGVKYWKENHKLPPDLAAAEPGAAAQAAQHPVGPTSGANVQRKSLDSLEHQLGAGEAVDKNAAGAKGAGDARIHRGAEADKMTTEHGAVAFAAGNNVVMSSNAPKQGTLAGDALLAHELAHTAQQRDAAKDPAERAKPIGAEEQGPERDADRAAGDAMSKEKLATLGNFAGSIGDVMRTGLQLQRCAKDSPGIDRAAYFKQYESQIAVDAANTIRKLPFGTMDASITWSSGGQQKFAAALADEVGAPSTNEGLESLVRPESMLVLIDKSRMVNEESAVLGPDQYFGAVGVEVANALTRRATESLQRELPRYAQAKLAGGGEPKADDLQVSHPIDPLVAKALTRAPVVTIDHEKFGAAHPELKGPPHKQDRSRNIVTEKVGETSMWYRLKDPMDATVEEIATALLGKPTEAFRITNAHPLYGVKTEPKADEFHGDPSTLDPAEMMLAKEPGLAEEAILSQAGSAKPTRSGARILEQMRLNSTLIGKTVFEHANKFGPDISAKLPPAAARIDARIAKLATAKEADIQKWDAQVSQQGEVINKVARGIQADLLRLQMFAAQFDTKLKDDPGAHKISMEHRFALHDDMELWCTALSMSDLVGSANAALMTAAQHSVTLETGILERQLGMSQQAVYSAKDSKTTQGDFDVSTMPARELEARQKLAALRVQAISDPNGMDANANAKTSEEARDLVFESSVIAQASQLDSAWKMLDDMDGTLSHITGDHGDLTKLKSQGKGYYNEWVQVQSLIKAGDKINARKNYETLCAKPGFQSFLSEVQKLVKDVQKHHLIATIIATIVITVVTMGAGIVVEGLVGGSALAAEVAMGAEVTADVASAARTARLAGMVANAATGALMNQIIFAKTMTLKGFFIDFGRNILLFGAMKGVAAGMKMAGLDKVITAGLQTNATAAQVIKGGATSIGEAVLNGGVAGLEALAEEKLKEVWGDGKGVSKDEAERSVLQSVVQMVGMAMLFRFAHSPIEKFKVATSFQGAKWKHALSQRALNRSGMEALGSGQHTSEEIVAAAKREQLLIADEIAALEELKARGPEALKGTGFDNTTGIDQQITALNGYNAKSRGFQFSFGMKEIAPDHYSASRSQMADILRTQAGLTKTPPKMEARSPETGSRTWVFQPTEEGSSPFRVTEEMPDWAITEPGKKLVAAAERANLDWVFEAPKNQVDAMLEYERALSSNDPKAIEKAEQGLNQLPKDHHDAVTTAFKGLASWRGAEQQGQEVKTLKEGGKLDPNHRQHLADELARQVPDIGLVDAVKSGQANTVLSVVVPGGGDTGIKAMNDEMVGYGINSSQLIPERNAIIKRAFEAQKFKVIDQGYKMTTLVTELPAAETAAGIQKALAQVDAEMKPLLLKVLSDGITHFQGEKAKLSPKDPNGALFDKRIDKMVALRSKITSDANFHFDFQLGAAEIKGGKTAGYDSILAAEMDASKAAIMARDGGVSSGRTAGTDGRAIVYSQADFLTFCKETVAMKDGLGGATLPYEGRAKPVFDSNGDINHDLLRAIRKDSYKKDGLTAEQVKTLEKLKQYITRVNSFDYVKHFTGDEVAHQGAEVAETAALVKKLQSGAHLEPADIAKIDALLNGGIPQAGAGNEAQFYNKAGGLQKRTVLNADIKDMGLDLFDGYAKTMDAVGRGKAKNLDGASASASDGIVRLKRDAADEFARYYRQDLMTKARELAAKRENAAELIKALDAEKEPTMLLGGDEITVSLSGAFEELGLLPEIVAKLTDPKVANARVSVTKTGAGDGTVETDLAMQRSGGGHDILKKKVEPLSRSLAEAEKGLAGEQSRQAKALVDRMNGMYTMEVNGENVLVDATGAKVEFKAVEAQAKPLIEAGGVSR